MKYFALILPFLLGLPILVFAQDTGFVPLTNIPQLTDLGNSFALDNFLNQLYRIAIGIAAVVAVLQIMRAGIMYMGGDSVTKKGEARQLIGLAIGGLVLVLSPVIVFSLVNPEILSLKIDVSKLGVPIGNVATSQCSPACGEGEWCERGACVQNPTIGDGSCSVDCTSGTECRAGQCVAIDTSSCTVFANGAPVPSQTDQQCCSAQNGCTVRAVLGSDNPPTCSCWSWLRSPITYWQYQEYDRRNIRRAEGTSFKVVPADATRVGTYVNDCRSAGGTMQYKRDDNWVENLVIARWGTCAPNSGVPAETGNPDTVYQCEDIEARCSLPS